VHVFATTHRGAPGSASLPFPRPPWDRADALVAAYLGPVRRAGQGALPTGTRAGEEDVMRAAGYAGPQRVEVPGGSIVERTADEVVSSMFSLSSSAPHLFGGRLAAFEADLRALLSEVSPEGRFAEETVGTAAVIWRP
jgi:hypothetical protein